MNIPHLDSKTMAGLAGLLVIIVGLSLLGKLTAETVDALKWIGGTFFGVRAVANYAEGKKDA